MDSNPDISLYAMLDHYSHYVSAAGIAIYLVLLTLGVMGFIDKNYFWLRLSRLLCWTMVISPIAIRWYFSHYAILWFACALCAVGVGIKIRQKLGI